MTPPRDARPGQRGDWRAILTLLPYLWQYRGRVALALILLVLSKVANVSVPLVLKHIVDALDVKHNAVLVLPLLLLISYGLLRLGTSLFGELRDAIFAKVTQQTIRRIALETFRHLHSLALRFHLDRQTGGVSRDIERGSRGISFLLTFMVFNILPTLVEISLIGGILFYKFSAWFATITLATVVVYVIFTFTVTEWRMKYRRTMNEMDSKANTRAIDSLLNYETVKYFGNEDFEARRYDENLQVWEQAAIKNQTSLSALNFGQAAIIAVGITALLILASRGVVDKSLTMGDLVMINAYLMQLFIPMNFLGFVYREIKHSLADMERMFKLLNEHTEVQDAPDAPPLRIDEGEIRFEHVSFAYLAERGVLFDVDFTVRPGQKLAVVGPSGAGKSTLVRLLFRFYDPDGGRIRIDGQDIRHVTQKSLRSAIGIVPQDTVLFNDTLYYNIAYGRPEASREEVIRAARLANLHDFIESTPHGYDTTVGERGLKLSGGEKQRVAIARVILKHPRIMVFDEATSALDSRTEQVIQASLRDIAAHHTTLVIAHRLSTVVDADQILVMEHGRVVERGAHRELLAGGGVYAHMWNLQQKERDKAVAARRKSTALDETRVLP